MYFDYEYREKRAEKGLPWNTFFPRLMCHLKSGSSSFEQFPSGNRSSFNNFGSSGNYGQHPSKKVKFSNGGRGFNGGNVDVPLGYCFQYHTTGQCDFPGNCRFKHSCPICFNSHSKLKCKSHVGDRKPAHQ